MSEVKKIYPALVAIADGLRQQGIAKSASSGNGKGQFMFKYRGIDSVYAALSPLLVANSVIIRPVTIAREQDSMSGSMRLVRIRVQYEAVCAIDGSSVTFEGIGEGCDSSDKAAGKALSYAYKTAMFQLFCIPVEGQEDSDAIVHSIEQPFVDETKLRKVEMMESEIVNCFSSEVLKHIADDIAKLKLAEDDPHRIRLLKKYTAQKKLIKDQANQI